MNTKVSTSLILTALLLLGLVFTCITPAAAKELADLKILYIGKERPKDYADFLKDKVAKFEAKTRKEFKPADSVEFDVVILDWPQGEETRETRKLTSPLGTREAWAKPTVLLGSAGLNLAVAWKLKGGTGCTCMSPLAYDLHEHEIFERPLKVDRSAMISIDTPEDFQEEIKEPTIKVLALVNDHQKNWNAGWCTYSNDFANNPDVELFCGGVNHKTPTAAGIWRQGNLLHFGFEQSPSEMNEAGKSLLLNSIVYISHFSEDRPIGITPSPFAGPVARLRTTPARWLKKPEFQLDWIKDLLSAETWEKISAKSSRETMIEWAEANAKFLHPDDEQQLEIDQDLVAIGVAFDTPEFFEKTLEALKSNEAADAARAKRLLARMARR